MKGEGRDRAASVKQRLANERKLREAACINQVEIVRTLLDLNTNPNAQDEVNLSPIVWLCRSLFLVYHSTGLSHHNYYAYFKEFILFNKVCLHLL